MNSVIAHIKEVCSDKHKNRNRKQKYGFSQKLKGNKCILMKYKVSRVTKKETASSTIQCKMLQTLI